MLFTCTLLKFCVVMLYDNYGDMHLQNFCHQLTA